mgnify:CR=1 FL=1
MACESYEEMDLQCMIILFCILYLHVHEIGKYGISMFSVSKEILLNPLNLKRIYKEGWVFYSHYPWNEEEYIHL